MMVLVPLWLFNCPLVVGHCIAYKFFPLCDLKNAKKDRKL